MTKHEFGPLLFCIKMQATLFELMQKWKNGIMQNWQAGARYAPVYSNTLRRAKVANNPESYSILHTRHTENRVYIPLYILRSLEREREIGVRRIVVCTLDMLASRRVASRRGASIVVVKDSLYFWRP